MDKQRIANEILLAARGSRTLSQREFEARGNVGLTTVCYHYGSWNEAVKAAGLEPIPAGVSRSNWKKDVVYLEAIIQVTKKLQKPPTESAFAAQGIFSVRPYYDRWGTFAKARETAYATLGNPLGNVVQKPTK